MNEEIWVKGGPKHEDDKGFGILPIFVNVEG